MKDMEDIKIAREETDLEWQPMLDGIHAYVDLRRLGRRLAVERLMTDETIAYLTGELERAIADVEKLTRERDEARRQAAALTEGLRLVSDALARLNQIYRSDIDLGDPPVETPAWLQEAQHRAAALLAPTTPTPAPTLTDAAHARIRELEARLAEVERERNEARAEVERIRATLAGEGEAKECWCQWEVGDSPCPTHGMDEEKGARAALAGEGEAKRCTWTYDETHCAWDSSCGEKWILEDGGPNENRIRFCHGCSKPVEVACEATPEKARQT